MKHDYPYKNTSQTYAHGYLRPSLMSSLDTEITRLKNPAILELGCGNGNFSQFLHERGARVTGIDSSESGIKLARSNFPDVRFACESVYDIKKSEFKACFDIVVSVEVIEHLLFPKELIKSAAFCLKPGGLLILTTPYHGYLKNLAISLLNKWDSHHGVSWDGGHVKFFSRRSLSEMVEKGGFKKPRFSYAGRFPLIWKSMICTAKLVTLLILLQTTFVYASPAQTASFAMPIVAVGVASACAGHRAPSSVEVVRHMVEANTRLSQRPTDAEAYLMRGLASEALGRQGRAAVDYMAAIKIDPTLADAHLGLGRAYANHDLIARSIHEFTAAIRLNPASAAAYRERALSYDALDSFPRSLADFKQAIRLEPSDACTYNDQGVTQEAAGFQEAALASYSQALTINSELPSALANRAGLLSDMGRFTESLADYDKALSLNPADTKLQADRTALLSQIN